MLISLWLACATPDGPAAVRLGYMPNVTHAPAIVALEKGLFAEALGPDTPVAPTVFSAGPAEVEALLSGAVDVVYIGPNPAINAYVKSHGAAVRVVAGCTSGGAALVVAPGVASAADLRGKVLATPQLGNTQDVAARAWLAGQGIVTNLDGTGEVSIRPMENAQTLEALRGGQVAGAWVPEPWASRLVLDGGGHVLVDERDLWPGGAYVTTHVLVRKDWWDAHPTEGAALLRGHAAAVAWTTDHPAEAKATVNAAIGALTGKTLRPEVLDRAWSNLTFTTDPIRSSLHKSADDAVKAGLLDLGGVDLDGLYAPATP